jgi:hypothetical protein
MWGILQKLGLRQTFALVITLIVLPFWVFNFEKLLEAKGLDKVFVDAWAPLMDALYVIIAFLSGEFVKGAILGILAYAFLPLVWQTVRRLVKAAAVVGWPAKWKRVQVYNVPVDQAWSMVSETLDISGFDYRLNFENVIPQDGGPDLALSFSKPGEIPYVSAEDQANKYVCATEKQAEHRADRIRMVDDVLDADDGVSGSVIITPIEVKGHPWIKAEWESREQTSGLIPIRDGGVGYYPWNQDGPVDAMFKFSFSNIASGQFTVSRKRRINRQPTEGSWFQRPRGIEAETQP